MHLAIRAEDAAAVDRHSGVVAGVAVLLAEAEGDDGVARHVDDAPDLRPVEFESGRQCLQPPLSRFLGLVAAAETGQVAAEAGLGQDEQLAAAIA